MHFAVYLNALASTALAMPAAVVTPEPAVTYTGQGTSYNPFGVAGSCGNVYGDNAFVAAISNYWMNNQSPGPYCGRQIQATNTGNGKTVTVVVQDTCSSCGDYDVDFTDGAWDQLTNGADVSRINRQWGFLPQ